MNSNLNFSKISAVACFIACIGDFLLTIILGYFYPGYNHLKLVMSELGTAKSPVAVWISTWWLIYGLLIIIFGIGLGKALNFKNTLSKLSAFLIILFGIGAGIGAGIFPYNSSIKEVVILDTLHDIFAGTGYIAILFLPIILIKLFLRVKLKGMVILSTITQIMGLIFFIIFITSENSIYKNNILAYSGLWQRLFLLNYYVYFLILSSKINRPVTTSEVVTGLF